MQQIEASRSSASVPVTVDVRWNTCGNASSSQRPWTATEPVSQTRPRSFRSTSTIITFSARSLALASNSAPRRASSTGSALRGRVPLIGRVSTRRPRSSMNRSGLAEAIAWSGAPKKAAWGAGESAARDSLSARARAVGSARSTGSVQRCERLAWKMSPARISSFTRSTAVR